MTNKLQPLDQKWIDRWRRKPLIAAAIVVGVVVVAIANFASAMRTILDLSIAHASLGAVPVILPKDTGWILCGYFDQTANIWTMGSFCEVARSQYKQSSATPRLGEQIRLRAIRNVVIADFATRGLQRQFEPPWTQDVLGDGDYTGLKLPPGAVVEVRDASSGALPGRPAAIWVRVGVPAGS